MQLEIGLFVSLSQRNHLDAFTELFPSSTAVLFAAGKSLGYTDVRITYVETYNRPFRK